MRFVELSIYQMELYAKDDYRNLSIPEVLLILDAPIDREQNIELRVLRGFEPFAIFRARQTRHAEPSGIHVEPDDSEGDEVRTHRGGPSFELANEGGLGVPQRVDGSLASDRGKILEKFI